jgi:hypothetical protein
MKAGNTIEETDTKAKGSRTQIAPGTKRETRESNETNEIYIEGSPIVTRIDLYAQKTKQ